MKAQFKPTFFKSQNTSSKVNIADNKVGYFWSRALEQL